MFACQTITFERFNIGSSYFHIQYISRQYGSSSYMKVIRSRSQDKKVDRAYCCDVKLHSTTTQIPFPRCENFIANKSVSITHRAVNCVCSIRFSAMARVRTDSGKVWKVVEQGLGKS